MYLLGAGISGEASMRGGLLMLLSKSSQGSTMDT